MSEEITIEEEGTESSSENLVVDNTRRVLLAAVGLGTLAYEGAEKVVRRLVDKGELAEEDGRSILQTLADKRAQKVQASNERVRQEVDRRMGSLLNRMNMPSKRDIDQLNEKIAALSAKVEALKSEETQSAPAASTPEADSAALPPETESEPAESA